MAKRLTLEADDLHQAVRLHQAGNDGAAEALYRRVLTRTPSNPDALHLLGVLVADGGRAGEGADLIERALALKPAFPEALSNRGNLKLQAGDAAGAEACYRTALALAPHRAQLHHNLALALQAQARLDDALAAAQQATALHRANPAYWLLTARLLVAKGGRLEEAERAVRQACALAPRDTDARIELGMLLFGSGRKTEAEAAFRVAVENDPASVSALYNLGAVLRARGDASRAETMLRRAVAADPGHADAWNALGACLRGLGRFEEAAASFRKALALRPGFASAWRHLTLTGRNVAGATDRHTLEALTRSNLRSDEAAAVHFALAKLLDEDDLPDRAFGHYRQANALVAAGFAGTPDAYDPAGCEAMIANLTRERPWQTPVAQCDSERPVLIVGVPRSGTSLIEQILASHPSVFGAGELPDLRQLTSSVDLAEAGKTYAERLGTIGQGAPRVTDKMPDNIFELGRVAAMLPRARVILCRRDPRDVGVSCFTTHFAAGNAYSYDLGHCGHRVRQTDGIADHWRAVLPLRMLTIDYEALVDDIEGQSRRMIEFLGLDWDPACLDFHRTRRTVNTASAWQVRQPLFRDSVARWKRYEPHLGALLAAL